ncbi:hypothetical protein CHS0354_006943 [Potamilus streckersoni]|uniref:DNA-directed DNA polymerase n=1 Tax=Potamilus streckersoni TaxID=2493646 RepID=A0AAE0TEH0_9BIVA|nr:hypothetical protein CHS0354_006943 [Potamilus streckersoni]
MNSTELKNKAVEICESVKCIEPQVYDYSRVYYETDYMLVCSATSHAHCEGIAEKLETELKKLGVYAHSVEGKEEKNWILLDYDSVIVHIFEMDRRRDIDPDQLFKERIAYLTSKDSPAKRHLLIYGNQPFEIREAVSGNITKLQKKYPHASVSRLNCDELSTEGEEGLRRFISELRSDSLFDNEGIKFVHIHNLHELNKLKQDVLKEVLQSIDAACKDANRILITDALIKKIPDLKKRAVKTLITHDNFNPSGKISEYAQRLSVRLSQEAVSMLGIACGSDLEVIYNEISKLSLTFSPDHEISVQDISLSVGNMRQYTMFSMTDSVVHKNIKAFIYNADCFAADKNSDPVGLFSLLGGRYQRINLITTMQEADAPPAAIKTALKTGSWLADKMIEEARIYTATETQQILTALSQHDLRIKFGGGETGFLILRQLCINIIRGVYSRRLEFSAEFCRHLIY